MHTLHISAQIAIQDKNLKMLLKLTFNIFE